MSIIAEFIAFIAHNAVNAVNVDSTNPDLRFS
jgi:hypothetical protein